MNWNGVKVFISGADGFIGSHLADESTKCGANVTALVQYNSFDSCGWLDESECKNDMKIIRGDVRDPEQMRSIAAHQHIIFHLAALISIPYSYEAVRSYLDTNVVGTENLLQAAVSGEGVRFVHTSTSEVYGSALYTPMPEAHPINPQSPYAASKVGADALVKAFVDSYRLDAVTLRPFNTFGPRQSERAVIPTIIRQSLDPKCESIQLGNLTTRRDLTYVGDTVNAFLAVGSLETPKGEVYNCGTGVSVSIENLARLICSMIENKPIVQATDRTRPIHSEVSDLVADIKKILPIWHSEVSLIEGLEKTIDWWRPRMDKIRKSPEYII